MSNVVTIASTANVLIQSIETGKEIYQTILNAMDSAERVKNNGADKKAWVLAFIESFINDLGENWKDWMQVVISFIDFSKSFYNMFK